MSQECHYFNFLCHSCTPKGGRGAKVDWKREGMLLYLLSWLQHHFKKPLPPHLTPVPQFKHQKGLVMEKTLLLDCCSATQYLITLCLRLPFLGHPTVFSFYWDSDHHHYKKPAASAGFARNSQTAKPQAWTPTKHIGSLSSSSVWVESKWSRAQKRPAKLKKLLSHTVTMQIILNFQAKEKAQLMTSRNNLVCLHWAEMMYLI